MGCGKSFPVLHLCRMYHIICVELCVIDLKLHKAAAELIYDLIYIPLYLIGMTAYIPRRLRLLFPVGIYTPLQSLCAELYAGKRRLYIV